MEKHNVHDGEIFKFFKKVAFTQASFGQWLVRFSLPF
jgi:hypothetical protein